MIPGKLAYCESFEQQVAWVRGHLMVGGIVTDPEMFAAGVDADRVIRALRASGMRVKPIRVPTVDASGALHKRTLAWKRGFGPTALTGQTC
jgi:hypothetical protein